MPIPIRTFAETVMKYFPDLVIHEINLIIDEHIYKNRYGYTLRPLLLRIKYKPVEQDPSEYKVIKFSEMIKIFDNKIPYIHVTQTHQRLVYRAPMKIRINTKELKSYMDQSFYSYDINEITNKYDKMLYDKLQPAVMNYIQEFRVINQNNDEEIDVNEMI